MAVAAADRFTIAVGPWTQDEPEQEIGQFGQVDVAANLDDGADVSFSVRGRSPTAKLISELDTDVWLFRDELPFIRARIIAITQAWGPDGQDEVSVTAVDYKRLFNARHVVSELTFSATDQAQIVWGLIQHAQAQAGGDLGIIAGTLGAGVPRDRTYYPGDNIGTMLSNLSGVIDGPWWGIGPYLELDCIPYSSFPVRDSPVLLGATARSLARNSGAASFANVAYVDGDSAATVPVWFESPTIGTDPRGRWEKAAGFPTVTEQATLDEKAEGLVQESLSPVAEWSCELEPSRWLSDADFVPGDYVQIVVPPTTAAPIGTPEFSVGAQVMNLSLTLTADGGAAASVECVEVA